MIRNGAIRHDIRHQVRLMRRLIWLAVLATTLSAGLLWYHRGPLRIALHRPTIGDVAYGVASPAQRLDFYAATTGAKPHPLVVYIHGGGFRFGDKREPYVNFVDGVERLNAAGLSVVSINYRLADEAPFPAAVADARSAVRYMRVNAARFAIDPRRIAVWGKSAGGNLALMVGVTAQESTFDDPAVAPDVSSAVSAVVAFYAHSDFLSLDAQLSSSGCPVDLITHNASDSAESVYFRAPLQSAPDRAGAASPIKYARPGLPPMLLQTGTGDCIVPHQQSEMMHAALQSHEVLSRLMLFKGAGHAEDAAFETAANHAEIIQFLKTHLGPAP